MYEVEGGDWAYPFEDAPSPAMPPRPVVIAGDFDLFLTYQVVPGTGLALIEFEQPLAHYFGSPNDEGLGGHPLRARGLDYYGAFEVHKTTYRRHERGLSTAMCPCT